MTTEEEVLLLAGPGSGKTRTIVDRIQKLLEDGVAASSIVCITFTNAGARVLEERIRAAVKDKFSGEFVLGYVGTLHGFCLRMLRDHGGFMGYGERISVVSPESAAALLESKARALGCKTSLKSLLELKRTGIGKGRLTVDESVVALYLDELREAGIVDYDLILSEFDRMMGESGAGYGALGLTFDYLFVDEVQDSAEADWRIYRNLGIRWKFFVGDPDQSIYGFRGAAVGETVAYGSYGGTHVIRLEENFRSSNVVCDAANKLIAQNTNRLAKETRAAASKPGAVVSLGLALTEGEEIALIARKILWLRENYGGRAFAVLTRTNHLAVTIRETIAAGGTIPVLEREVSLLPRDWAYTRSVVELLANPDNDTLAYFNLIEAGTRNGALSLKQARSIAHEAKLHATASGKTINRRIMNLPYVRTANDAAIVLADRDITLESRMLIGEKVRELPRDASVLELALAMAGTHELVEEGKRDPANPPLEVLTIHSAKGREFDAVFLAGFEDEVIPGRRKDVDLEEERRLAYVGLTRARDLVFVSGAVQRVTKWGAFETHTASRFAKEIFA